VVRYQCISVTDWVCVRNSGRNVLIGPGVSLLDGSIRKEFATTETQRLEFRAEFFNILFATEQ
jgi:hypothetical protein